MKEQTRRCDVLNFPLNLRQVFARIFPGSGTSGGDSTGKTARRPRLKQMESGTRPNAARRPRPPWRSRRVALNISYSNAPRVRCWAFDVRCRYFWDATRKVKVALSDLGSKYDQNPSNKICVQQECNESFYSCCFCFCHWRRWLTAWWSRQLPTRQP